MNTAEIKKTNEVLVGKTIRSVNAIYDEKIENEVIKIEFIDGTKATFLVSKQKVNYHVIVLRVFLIANIAALLSVTGFPYYTWQFWAFIFLTGLLLLIERIDL